MDKTLNISTAAFDGVSIKSLPDRPLIAIRPGGRWAPLHLREFWAHRELLYFLVLRDLKVRYKQTLLGAAWIILQPLLTTAVFTLLFAKLVGIRSDGTPYPLFAYAGLLPWMFFSKAVSQSANSLLASSNLITRVYFPRLIIPCSAVLACLADFGVGFGVLAALIAYYAVEPSYNLLLLPLLVVLTTSLALGAGIWFSSLNVKYRDVGALLPFVIQLLMFATPIIYPLSLVPEKWRWAVSLNPLTGIIDGYRAALFGLDFNWPALGVSASLTLTLLVYSVYAFRRRERSFADVI